MKTHWDQASHFIGSEACRFGCTDVANGYIISTIGDYFPPFEGKRITIGYGRFYETMVFKDSGKRCEEPECPCGGIPEPSSWSEVDFEGYKTKEQAIAGHARMLLKYKENQPT